MFKIRRWLPPLRINKVKVKEERWRTNVLIRYTPTYNQPFKP